MESPVNHSFQASAASLACVGWMLIALGVLPGGGSLAAEPQQAEPAPAQPVAADLVVVNARVCAPSPSPATALAVVGERIAAVGSQAEIEKWIGPETTRIDAGGNSVTPGFNDAHAHFLSGSLSLAQVELADADSPDAIVARIDQFAKDHPDREWIMGRGWVYGTFAGGLPDKRLLDEILADRPAVMECYDGHTLWVNSAALRRAGITRSTVDPPGGVIVRDPVTGEPTGVLKESAQTLIEEVQPEPTREEKLSAVKVGIARAHRCGVTSVQDAGVGLAELDVFERLRAAGQLPLRMSFALEGQAGMSSHDVDQLHALRHRFPQLNISAVKLYVDGVVESHTAALLAPYANRSTRGLSKYSQEELNRTVAMLDRDGWQILVHAIGDGGVRMTLDAFERAQRVNPPPERGRRHRLEHIETISQQDIARFGQLGVVASMQPYHANPDSNVFQIWAANLGPERAERAWAWKSIRDAGGRLAFGSDWPVVGIDPRLGLHTALTRQTLDGQPAGGFVPQQRLPLEDVLEAYTAGSAYAEFADDQKGTLAAGKLADLLIWNADLFSLPAAEVHAAEVAVTVLGGRVMQRTDSAPQPAR